MSSPASFEDRPPLILRHNLIFLTVFCLFVWLPGFFTLMPTDRDESRFAQATKQMLETGDYLRIMNGTEPRNRKPIGIYWAQVPFACAARAVGLARADAIWPYRLPSLLGALLAVLAVARGGEFLIGKRRATLAAAWFASCLLLVSEAHLAKTDAALVGVTTVAMLLLGRAYLTPAKMNAWHAAGFWIACAAGILLKGPITPLIAGLAIITLGCWSRRWNWLRALRPGWGIMLLLLLVLPWFIAIGIATKGAFFADSVHGDLGSKISGGDDAHGHPFGIYLLLIPLVAFPAAAPILRAFPAVWRGRGAEEVKFLIAWLVPAWLMFELVPTKLPHYTLPLYPAMFLLAAHFETAAIARWWRNTALGITLLAGAALSCGVLAAPFLLHGAHWAGVPAALLILLICGLIAAGRQSVALLMLPLALIAVFEIELPRLPALLLSPRINQALEADHLHGLGLGEAGYDEPSLMFLAGTNTQWFRTGTLLGNWMKQHPGNVAIVEARELKAFTRTDPAVVQVGEVDGFDYSNGKWVKIEVLR